MWTRGTPCFSASSATRSTTCRSVSAVASYLLLAIWSVSDRSVLLRRPVARQPPRGERAVWGHPDPFRAAERQHLPLLLAVDEVQVVLHRDEAGPPVPLGDVQRLLELPRPHRRRADVAGLAGPHHVVQRLHRLLDRACRSPSGESCRGPRSPSPAAVRLWSISLRIALRDSPAPFGPSRIRPCTLVAMTTSSRFAKSFSARPRISSLRPRE